MKFSSMLSLHHTVQHILSDFRNEECNSGGISAISLIRSGGGKRKRRDSRDNTSA